MIYVLMAIPIIALISYSWYLFDYSKKNAGVGKIAHDISMDNILNCEYKLRLFLSRNNLDVYSSNLLADIVKKFRVEEDKTAYATFRKKATLEEHIANGERGYLVKYKKGLNDSDKAFNLGHELGHLILLHNLPAAKSEGHNRKETEQLADYVAAAILMPAESVYDYLKKDNPSYDDALSHLTCVYKVSSDVAARRLVEIADLEDEGFFINPSEQRV